MDQPDATPAAGLSDRERDMLAFERRTWRHAAAKEDAVRELFGVSVTAYYQRLGALIDRPEALAHDPVLVARLRRVRAAHARSGPRLTA